MGGEKIERHFSIWGMSKRFTLLLYNKDEIQKKEGRN